MKSSTLTIGLTLLAFASAAVVPSHAARLPAAKSPQRHLAMIATNVATTTNATTEDNVVSGRVTAKTDTSLSVEDRLVQVMSTTVITKKGLPIRLADIGIGETVRATTVRGLVGSTQAATIEVITE